MHPLGGTSRFVRQTTLTRTKSERPITRPALEATSRSIEGPDSVHGDGGLLPQVVTAENASYIDIVEQALALDRRASSRDYSGTAHHSLGKITAYHQTTASLPVSRRGHAFVPPPRPCRTCKRPARTMASGRKP